MTPMSLTYANGLTVHFDASDIRQLRTAVKMYDDSGPWVKPNLAPVEAEAPVEVEKEAVTLNLHEHVVKIGTQVDVCLPEQAPFTLYCKDEDHATAIAIGIRIALREWVTFANRAHVEVIG